MADVHQRFEEAPQQFFQIARFQLDAEQLVKRLRFGLADLIIGVVQRQDDAEMELLADPLKIGVLVRHQRHQQRRQQPVVFLERFENRAGRQIQLGRAAAVVFHLLDELQRSFPCARMRAAAPGVICASAIVCLGSNSELPQAAQELAVDLIGVRLEQHRQTVQMHT